MERIHEILLRRNFPHVATITNSSGDMEELDASKPLNVDEIVLGLAELNRSGIVLLDIHAGVSREGVTKISDVSNAGLFLKNEWILEPKNYEDVNLPEVTPIPFKSDAWVLGEFIVRINTGKDVPKRFLKSQALLDKFCEGILTDAQILKKLLVIDPSARSCSWDVVKNAPDGNGCTMM
jgi:hypothetical protein